MQKQTPEALPGRIAVGVEEEQADKVEEKQEAEVGIAAFEACYTEISAAARPVLANTVDGKDVVIDIAAADTAIATIATIVAIIEVVDLLFLEPSVQLARSSYRP